MSSGAKRNRDIWLRARQPSAPRPDSSTPLGMTKSSAFTRYGEKSLSSFPTDVKGVTTKVTTARVVPAAR